MSPDQRSSYTSDRGRLNGSFLGTLFKTTCKQSHFCTHKHIDAITVSSMSYIYEYRYTSLYHLPIPRTISSLHPEYPIRYRENIPCLIIHLFSREEEAPLVFAFWTCLFMRDLDTLTRHAIIYLHVSCMLGEIN